MARRREAGTPGRAPDAGRDPSHRRGPAPGRLSTRAVGVWERGSRRQVTDARLAQMARTIGRNPDAPAAEPECIAYWPQGWSQWALVMERRAPDARPVVLPP
jgi:hypothetical protein